jgi:hypothetical protein
MLYGKLWKKKTKVVKPFIECANHKLGAAITECNEHLSTPCFNVSPLLDNETWAKRMWPSKKE